MEQTEKVTPIYPVNMRSAPDIGAPLVFCGPKHQHYMMPGRRVQVIERKDGWVKVNVSGDKVWCLDKYMQRV